MDTRTLRTRDCEYFLLYGLATLLRQQLASGALLTIAIVDPDKQYRQNLERLFESFDAPSEEFETGEAYLSSIVFGQDHVAAITLKQLDIDGFDLIRLAKSQGKALAVFAVMDDPSVPAAVRAMRLGVADVLIKPISTEPILRASLLGKGFNPDTTANAGPGIPTSKPLSKREREVLDFLLAGKTCRHIANTLKISVRTAEAHRRNIFQKTGVHSQVDLVRKLHC